MRKIIILLGFIVMSTIMLAQQTNKIYLKNGSEINGVILEQVPNENIKIKTSDGSVFVFRMDEVDHIGQSVSNSSSTSNLQTQKHRGLDLTVSLGPLFSLQSGGGTSFMADLEVGKKLSKNTYVGVGGGVITGSGYTNIPVFAAFRYYMPLASSQVTPTFSFRGGYSIATGDASGAGLIEIMPGVQIPLSPSLDFNAGIGYMATFADGNTGHGLGIRVGFGIHNATGKEKKFHSTRNSGLQYELEGAYRTGTTRDGNSNSFSGFGIGISYKWDQNISFGVGLQIAPWSDFTYQYWTESKNGDAIEKYDKKGSSIGEGDVTKFFVRGKYRFNDGKASPFASIDLGIASTDYSEEYTNEEDIKGKTIIFVNPSVGYSLRIMPNSYIEAKVGYSFGGKFFKDRKTDWDKRNYRSCEKYDNQSGFTIGVTFVHTTKLFQR